MLHAKAFKTTFTAVLMSALLPVAAAHGLSTNNPQFRTKEGPLGEGSTLAIKAKASGVQKLEVGENPVVCKTTNVVEEKEGKAVEHNLKGSKAPNPGTGAETLVFGECEVEGAGGCLINGVGAGKAKVETEPLKDTLVYPTKSAAEKEEATTLTLFEPQNKAFAVVKISGICPHTGEFKIEEKILAENEPGKELKEMHTFTFPSKQITTYFKNVSGKTEEVKLSEKKGFGCFLLGIAIVLYVGVVVWGLWP